ncbi:MAG TPA: 4Fe-4S binding protein [Spirochaetota bacterium]|nr:4Fe-4S binding protein [Spirochaetota bacterium]HOL57673.1 4Fe-4S binding protein [Spirochaetota bacterium]HPP05271.1 4Fe-4S binding protein [Spirochaetota bacterium]
MSFSITFILTLIFFFILFFTTLIFGRYYCQYICALGILQDILPSFKNLIKNFKWLNNKNLKLFLRIAFFILILFGFIIYIEPYSLFSKIIIYPIKSFFYLIYNYIIIIFKNFHLYLSPLKYNIDLMLLIINLIILILLLILNLIQKRFFCNFICPTGSLLYTLSKYPLIGIKFTNQCISCGLCGNICPTLAIDVKNGYIDNGECILCMKCIEKCKYNGIRYDFTTYKNIKTTKNRRYILLWFLFIPILFLFKKNKFLNLFLRSKNYKKFIIPPGAISLDNILTRCISCGLCIIQCPTKVIRFENYIPILDYNNKYCLYECKRCSEVCPVDAITPISLKEKMLTQIGYSEFFISNCIVYTDETDCGACSEHCPTKAVYMVPYKNGLFIPELDNKICIGCGACQYACPSKPKAIIVKSNPVHKKALEPKKDKKDPIIEEKLEEFPF